MPIIKRYPNRKLYNTDSKRYITLEGIAKLIRVGDDVQVLDHASGEDLTTLTLTQIIFEQEKKQSGFLPRPVLTGLIQAGGDTLGALRRTLVSPLDVFRHVDEEIDRRIDTLVSGGKVSEEEGRRWLQQLKDVGRKADSLPPEEEIERILAERGVPSRDELESLNQQLDNLASKLDQLAQGSEDK